ncbi:unnamed protein product, partial [Amoebophrya sp. A120]
EFKNHGPTSYLVSAKHGRATWERLRTISCGSSRRPLPRTRRARENTLLASSPSPFKNTLLAKSAATTSVILGQTSAAQRLSLLIDDRFFRCGR